MQLVVVTARLPASYTCAAAGVGGSVRFAGRLSGSPPPGCLPHERSLRRSARSGLMRVPGAVHAFASQLVITLRSVGRASRRTLCPAEAPTMSMFDAVVVAVAHSAATWLRRTLPCRSRTSTGLGNARIEAVSASTASVMRMLSRSLSAAASPVERDPTRYQSPSSSKGRSSERSPTSHSSAAGLITAKSVGAAKGTGRFSPLPRRSEDHGFTAGGSARRQPWSAPLPSSRSLRRVRPGHRRGGSGPSSTCATVVPASQLRS